MISQKTRTHLRDAAGSGGDAVHEAVLAGTSAARALGGAISALGHTLPRAAEPPRTRGLGRADKRGGGKSDEPARGKRLGRAQAKRLKKAEKASAKPRGKAAARTAARRAPVAPLTATGWFVLAAVIVAWPRERSEHRLEGRLGTRLTGLRDRLREELSTAHSATADLARRDPGRGRDAETPAQIPPKGWLDILKRAWTEFNADRITAVAGGITFFGLLALFPAMGAFVSLYGLFADSATVSDHLRVLAGVIPAEALKFVGEQMVRMANTHGSTLSLTFIGTLLVSLWSANAGVKAMFDGLNVAYEEREKRGLVKLNLISLAFTIGGIAFLALATASVIAVPIVLGLVGWKLGGLGPWLDILRWPVLLAGSIVALSVLYRYGPSRQHAKWAWVTPGSAVAAVVWLLASMLFSWYVAHFGSYNKTYGSLGAVVGFLTWMWLSAIIVLFGAELNSEIEHQTAADSTTGPPERMGHRGARMADTLG